MKLDFMEAAEKLKQEVTFMSGEHWYWKTEKKGAGGFESLREAFTHFLDTNEAEHVPMPHE